MSRHLKAAEEEIRDDDAAIAEALKSASIPTLMMSLIHMTGGRAILEGLAPPRVALLNETQGGMTDEEKAAVRAVALEVIADYRDRGCTLPPPPDPAMIHEMMSFMVGQEVSDAYVPMMLEELALDGEDARVVRLDPAIGGAEKRRLHVLVIGAGMSGILTAIRLREAGIPFTVVEKNTAVGGTWYENTYPGCRVDVGNHFYCYSFAPNHGWSEYFSQHAELQRYFEDCVDRFGIRGSIRFETEVLAARWSESEGVWDVALRGPAGEERLKANIVVSAVGQLNRPSIPDFPGRDSFEGPSFHSAEWRHDVDLAGRRVAVIGTGASAFQLVPELAKVAGRLSVFQRSPAWMTPNPHYHARVSEGKKWLLRHLPYYSRWYRFLQFWPGSDGLWPSLVIDPEWPHPERSVNALNEAIRVAFVDYMKSQLDGRPDLLEKVVPSYPPFGKRMLQDNGTWLSALKRENVDLVTDGIREIVPEGIVTDDGTRHPVDVIVYATGFHANRFLWPMQIVGKGGIDLRERWGDEPEAYLGITVADFPNLFCLYGPSTNLAHAGSIIFHSECQVRYVMGCIRALLAGGHAAVEVKPEVQAAFNRRLREVMSKMVWSHPGMTSWYKNRAGRVTTTSPWKLVEYWSWTREPDPDDYLWT